jgi:hypothetical protein
VQHAIQQLPRSANEGLALTVFLLTWSLAHQHPVSLLVANAENRLGAASGQAAGLTTLNGVA